MILETFEFFGIKRYNFDGADEVCIDGKTGFIAESVDELVVAIRQVEKISRADCRAEFENRFTATHMAERYEELYGMLLAEKPRIERQRSAMLQSELAR